MSVRTIVDEVAVALEPVAARRDGSLARPVEYEPDMLYAWPRSERFDPDGTGDLDEERFDIRIGWAAAAEDEQAGSVRLRATSDLIHDRVGSIAALVRGVARNGTSYEHLQIASVDYEALITTRVRGFLMDLTGYTQQG